MRRSPPQFHDPIDAAYRQHPPDLVAAAEAAGHRLQDPADYEALHDFRVAVRRLRTHIEAHRSQLGKRRTEKLLEQLGELASATNTFRDREVQREWLMKQTRRKSIAKLQREGLGLVLNDLNGSDPPKSAQPLDLLGHNFARICRDFKQRWTSPSGGGTNGHDRLNTAMARAIIKHSATLRRQLAKLRSLDDVKATHRARLAVKRLRYLLEPLDQLMPGARKIVRDLKGLQDRLGDLRDLQILETHITVKVGEAAGRWSERLVAAGTEDLRVAAITRNTAENRACYALAAGMQRVRSEARREFKELHKRWLNGSADRLVDRIERVARRL
jgi:CHAD domain-containing protein